MVFLIGARLFSSTQISLVYGVRYTGLTLETPSPQSELPAIARAASVIALGNVASRVLGLAREIVKAHLFGASGNVDALSVALLLPNQIYDLVTGGIVNSALVPVFSDYTAEDRRAELWKLASVLLTIATIALSLLIGVLTLFTPAVTFVVSGGFDPEILALTASLLRITLPGVVFLSLSGIVSGLLYSLKRFTLPAFTAAVFNAAIVVCALLLAERMGVQAMALGLLVGAMLQLAIQFPALRDALSQLRPSFQLDHPGLRRIVKLYVPIILGLIITQASIYIGLNLASRTGEGGIAWMGYATYIYQFPAGLVATALSFAILPTLSRQNDLPEFKATLVQGLNLVLALIVPATVGLFVLARPVVALLYERGEFTAFDTAQTALVLQMFLCGLIFAAVDQMLIFAFYARKDTLTPSVVGVMSVAVYVGSALALIQPLGLFSLMVADALKQMTHALITGWLLSRRVGGFWRTSLLSTLVKILAATTLTGLAAWLTLGGIGRLALPPGLAGRVATVVMPTAAAVVVYVFVLGRLRVSEIDLLLKSLSARLARAGHRAPPAP